MSYIALYRKWRPKVFEDVVEQEHVVKTLKNAVSSNRIAHAYLFCGTRGTGKTTMAKIFSRAINCENPNDGDPCNECEVCKGILSGNLLDVIEIDAASNNSVENVRDIRDEVVYAPSKARFKVYIIDEVHMLSTGAFNALLKTLEEPPSHVVFILATTEPHKLPVTILSRCQRFDFRRISVESIMGRLNEISSKSEINLNNDAARLIAKMADGALRDAISILDQCIALGNKEITYEDALSVIGIVNDTFIADIVDALNLKDIQRCLELVESLIINGKDIGHFVSDVVQYFRNLLICKVTEKSDDIIEASMEMMDKLKSQCANMGQEEIIYIIKELSALESSLKWATHPRVLLEVALIKICESASSFNSNNILVRLESLEKKLASGNITISAESRDNYAVKPAAGTTKTGTPVKAEASSPSNSDGSKGKPLPKNSNFDWEDVLKEIKNSGRMAAYTSLIGTKAHKIDDKTICIVFGNGLDFNKTLVSKPDNLEAIQNILNRRLGGEFKVKCVDEDYIPQKTAQPAEEKDELLEKADGIAKLFNAPLNIIDE